MRKKHIPAFILAILMVFVLAACNGGGGPSSSKPAGDPYETLEDPDISIVYWMSPEYYASAVAKDPSVYDPILDAIGDFEEKYSGKVTVIKTDWNSMLSTTIAKQESDEAPDLIEVYDRTMHNVILQSVVMPLDDYVTDADFSFYKVDRSLFQWRGKTYAVPIKPYTFYIMFNKTMFEMEGLETPDVTYQKGEWTFDKFAEVGKKLTKTVNGEIVQWGFASWDDCITSFMLANDSALLKVDTLTGTVTSGLNDPKVINTINAFSEWYTQPGGFINLNDDMFGLFDGNKLAMCRGKEYPLNDLPFEVGMVPFPTGPDTTGKTLVTYPQAFAVPTGAKNVKGAMAFMYMVNERQKAVGDAREAARIGQENYNMIYADDVKPVYAYDKAPANIDSIIGSILNYAFDKVPGATIAETVNPTIEAAIEMTYGNN